MAKTASDHLFRLIKSLSSSEKRYFKVMTNAEAVKEPLYLTLFDLIDVATVFDDTVFQRKLYGKNETRSSKKYQVLKAYLYDLVLRALQAFDAQNSVAYKLNTLLQSVTVLFKRGLYTECEPILNKAEKMAEHYECFSHWLEVMEWRKQLAYTRADIDYLDKELQRIYKREQEVLALQADTLQARQAFFSVYLQVRRDVGNTAKRVETAAPTEPPKPATEMGSTRAEVFRLRARNLSDYANQDPEAFKASGYALLQYIEAYPHFLKENLTEYIAALSNYIVACGLLNDYDAVEATLQKLRTLVPNTLDDRMKIHRQYYSNRFALSVFSGAFEAGRVLIDEHNQASTQLGLTKYESDTTLVQYFLICFGCANYDRALEYLNDWMNQPRTLDRADIQSVARVLNLLIHFEQGNLLLLEYKLRGTERYIRSRKKEYALERLFIKLISDLIKLTRNDERRDLYTEAKIALQAIEAQPAVRTLLKTFDFEAWLTSKITGLSFEQVVQEKFRKLTSKA